MGTRGMQDPIASDLIEQILADQARLNAEIDDLRRTHPILMERARTSDITVPQEGQIIVDSETEAIKYHSNQEWRDIPPSPLAWIWRTISGTDPATVCPDETYTKAVMSHGATSNSADAQLITDGIKLIKPGFWLLMALGRWIGEWDGGIAVRIDKELSGAALWGESPLTLNKASISSLQWDPVSRITVPWIIPPYDDELYLWFFQDSGSNRNVGGKWLYAIWLGPYTGAPGPT